jgi:hypothetical protein
VQLTGPAGVAQEYTYNAFGTIVAQQDPNFLQPYTYTGRELVVNDDNMKRLNTISPLLLLVGWIGYLFLLAGHRYSLYQLGSGLGLVITFPLYVLVYFRLAEYRNVLIFLLLGFVGYLGLDHLLAYILFNPVSWHPFLILIVLVPPFVLLSMSTYSSLFLWDKQASLGLEEDAAKNNAMTRIGYFQMSYVAGFSLGVFFFSGLLLIPGNHHQRALAMSSILMGCLGVGGVVNIIHRHFWFPHDIGHDFNCLLRTDLLRRESPWADWKAISIFVLILLIGTACEMLRGFWVFWGVSSFTFTVIFVDFWLVFRHAFQAPPSIVVRPNLP